MMNSELRMAGTRATTSVTVTAEGPEMNAPRCLAVCSRSWLDPPIPRQSPAILPMHQTSLQRLTLRDVAAVAQAVGTAGWRKATAAVPPFWFRAHQRDANGFVVLISSGLQASKPSSPKQFRDQQPSLSMPRNPLLEQVGRRASGGQAACDLCGVMGQVGMEAAPDWSGLGQMPCCRTKGIRPGPSGLGGHGSPARNRSKKRGHCLRGDSPPDLPSCGPTAGWVCSVCPPPGAPCPRLCSV